MVISDPVRSLRLGGGHYYASNCVDAGYSEYPSHSSAAASEFGPFWVICLFVAVFYLGFVIKIYQIATNANTLRVEFVRTLHYINAEHSCYTSNRPATI